MSIGGPTVTLERIVESRDSSAYFAASSSVVLSKRTPRSRMGRPYFVSPIWRYGETKYGRPILDRGVRFDKTTLEEAAKYALLSLDSTMRSNVTVGPPIDRKSD